MDRIGVMNLCIVQDDYRIGGKIFDQPDEKEAEVICINAMLLLAGLMQFRFQDAVERECSYEGQISLTWWLVVECKMALDCSSMSWLNVKCEGALVNKYHWPPD